MATFQGGIGGGGGGPNVYGRRPSPTPLPDVFGDLSKRFPNLAQTNNAVSGAINAQLGGQLTPGSVNQIQDIAAQWGAGAGMPGFSPGSLVQNRGLRDIGRMSEDQVQRGLQNYNQTVPTFSQTQTLNPALQAEINSQNNVLEAAPDPTAAASHAQMLYDKYLQQTQSPAGGTGGVNSAGPARNSFQPGYQINPAFQNGPSEPGLAVDWNAINAANEAQRNSLQTANPWGQPNANDWFLPGQNIPGEDIFNEG